MAYNTGDAVRVIAGRDSGRLMRVIGIRGELVLLADGRHRTVEHPKQKNPKHVTKVETRADSELALAIRRGETIRNSELRKDLAAIGQEKAEKDRGGK